MHGSFVASYTGTQDFQILIALRSTLELGPPTLTFDGANAPLSTPNGLLPSTSLTLTTDFRYAFSLVQPGEAFEIQMGMQVSWTGQSWLSIDSMAELCEQSGCRDLNLQRSPYACKPAPSVSQSPLPTAVFRPSGGFSETDPFTGEARVTRTPTQTVPLDSGVISFGSTAPPASGSANPAPTAAVAAKRKTNLIAIGAGVGAAIVVVVAAIVIVVIVKRKGPDEGPSVLNRPLANPGFEFEPGHSSLITGFNPVGDLDLDEGYGD
jgi:hypothetical protein